VSKEIKNERDEGEGLGGSVLMNKSTYKEKISSPLDSGLYEILTKDSTAQIEKEIRTLLTKDKTSCPLH
jgi:hypothetical protein